MPAPDPDIAATMLVLAKWVGIALFGALAAHWLGNVRDWWHADRRHEEDR